VTGRNSLGELSSAEYAADATAIEGPDWHYRYEFKGEKKEKLIQVVAASITFTGNGKSCTVSVKYPERFRLGKGKNPSKLDLHGMHAQSFLTKYCSCVCVDCKKGAFTANMHFELYHGDVATEGDPDSFDYLTSINLAGVKDLTPTYTVKDCDGKEKDIKDKIKEDWYNGFDPAGTGSVGRKAKCAKVDHAYSGGINEACETVDIIVPPKDVDYTL